MGFYFGFGFIFGFGGFGFFWGYWRFFGGFMEEIGIKAYFRLLFK